uniref:Uncharacterized protein n=1 Tax=Arion vulgaris TaxID=1028688 RepID=A0A0B7A8L1_9EUPU
METMAKLSNDFDAVIREMRLPMSSSESMNSRSTQQHDSNLYPPSYDAVQNTDAKLRFPLRPQRNTESTERKFTYTSSKDLERDTSSDSEDSDTDVKTRYTIKDKPDLLKQIEALRKEQKELEQKLEIHEQHIKDLSEREPCVHKRFKSMRKSLMFQQTTETFMSQVIFQQRHLLKSSNT